MTSPQGSRSDPYYWLRDDTRKDRDVLGYLTRENEYAALSLGVPARRLKVAAGAASAALAAVTGALWAQYVGFVDPF